MELTREALELQRELNVTPEIATSLRVQGMLAQSRGDHARAAALYEESLALYRKVGHQKSIDVLLAILALVRCGEE